MQRNYVELAGYLGADPDVRTTANGDIRATFPFATTERWGKGPEAQRTEWHRIVAWGATANYCGQHLKKGTHIFIEGQLRTRTYEKAGEKRTRVEVHLLPMGIEFLRPKSLERGPDVAAPSAESNFVAGEISLVAEVSR